MDPILLMLMCSVVEAIGAAVMAASLLYLAYDQWRKNLNDRRADAEANRKGTW